MIRVAQYVDYRAIPKHHNRCLETTIKMRTSEGGNVPHTFSFAMGKWVRAQLLHQAVFFTKAQLNLQQKPKRLKKTFGNLKLCL